MAFRLTDGLAPAPGDRAAEVRKWQVLLETGNTEEQRNAATRLTELRAETALTTCLGSRNPVVGGLAAAGLWECWLSEQGPTARAEINKGIERMQAGHLAEALELFNKLTEKYPDWAEAYNKQATVLYMLGSDRLSLKIAQKVVALKPNHFGAWNGIALCAAKLEKWRVALQAARKGLSLQPYSQDHLNLIRLAQQELGEED